MRKISLCLFLLFVGSFATQAWASPAYPRPVNITQADGSVLSVVLKGDEHLKWAQTIDGYTILRNAKGIYEYAVKDSDGGLILSGKAAHNATQRKGDEANFLVTMPKRLFYSKGQLSMVKRIRQIKESEQRRAFPTTGARKLVCILMGFKDKAFTKSKANFENLFNQVGYSLEGATGSVKDYYNENSYNQFNLSVTVAGPYVSVNNMSYYGGNDADGNDLRPEALVTEAVNAADATVNFADFDNDKDGSVDGVYVIYAGYGEEADATENAIWAHAYYIPATKKDGKTISSYSCSAELAGESGSSINTIGVICHEFGHVMGAPDYYDTDYGDGGDFEGTGNWDLMAGGSWNNDGKTPAHHNAYTKVKVYGWATATVISAKSTVTVDHAEKNKSFYQINSATSGEYWIMENRQQVGFDAYLPGHGLMIYHVHSGVADSYENNDINVTYPQKMYPVCANATGNPSSTTSSYGTINGGGCPFPGTGVKTSFTDATTPCMKSWAGANTAKPITAIVENTTNKTITFTFMGGSVTPTAPVATTNTATAVINTGATLNGQVNANNAAATVTFEYGTTTTYGSSKAATPATVSGATATNVSAALTGLAANTTYYYRVKAVNSAGTTYGSQLTFKTTSVIVAVPSATTIAATAVNASGATLNGQVNATNATTSVTFEYGTTTTYGSSKAATPATVSGAAATNVAVALTGLTANTTYYYRVKAVNSAGTTYGSQLTFKTTAVTIAVPSATTIAATAVTASGATLNGQVNANNATTTVTFEYGTTTAYGTTKAATPATVSGSTATNVSVALTGLAVNTTYYYRVKAVNSAGTTYGAPQSFVTSAATYCNSMGGYAADGWISLVKFAEINMDKSSTLGYIDNSAIMATVAQNSTVTLSLCPGFSNTVYEESWVVWIDYDQSKTFDSNEKVVDMVTRNNTAGAFSVNIPSTAMLGATRMRVSMKRGSAQSACELFSFGQVMDFTINVVKVNPTGIDDITTGMSFSIFPNPASNQVTIQLNGIDGDVMMRIYDMRGALVKVMPISGRDTDVDVSDLAKGVYIISVDEENDAIKKQFIKL